MTSTKGTGLMAAWQAYRRHFGSLMGSMAVIGCVSAMAFVPLLFMAVPETAFLCWLCPVMFKSYAVYTTRGAAEGLNPAVDWIIH